VTLGAPTAVKKITIIFATKCHYFYWGSSRPFWGNPSVPPKPSNRRRKKIRQLGKEKKRNENGGWRIRESERKKREKGGRAAGIRHLGRYSKIHRVLGVNGKPT